MRRFLIILFLINGLSSGITAQNLTPASGKVKEGTYQNSYFGFSYAFPRDWVVHGDATAERIMELGKARATSTKALSEATADIAIKHVHSLLTLFKYALGTPGIGYNPGMQILAEDIRHAPAVTDGRIYLVNSMVLLKKMGCEMDQDEPVAVMIGGRQFFRIDFKTPIQDVKVQQVMLATTMKGYALSFGFTAGPEQNIEELVTTMDSLKFSVAPRRRR